MAAPHKVTEFLPQAEPPRPNRKSRSAPRKSGKVLTLAVFWLLTLVVSLLLVHRNGLVLREKATITQTRTELARLEKKNQEQEARLVQLTSVADIERWAHAQNMQRPTVTKVLTPDPNAVARKALTPQLSSTEGVHGEPTGFWGAVAGYVNLFAGLLSTSGPR